MYVDSLSRIFLVCFVTLVLTACGGSGGGSSLIGGGSSSGGGAEPTPNTGEVILTISGMVDENGDTDNVLAGNEVATLTAEVTKKG
jgi:hypothetical protein